MSLRSEDETKRGPYTAQHDECATLARSLALVWFRWGGRGSQARVKVEDGGSSCLGPGTSLVVVGGGVSTKEVTSGLVGWSQLRPPWESRRLFGVLPKQGCQGESIADEMRRDETRRGETAVAACGTQFTWRLLISPQPFGPLQQRDFESPSVFLKFSCRWFGFA